MIGLKKFYNSPVSAVYKNARVNLSVIHATEAIYRTILLHGCC